MKILVDHMHHSCRIIAQKTIVLSSLLGPTHGRNSTADKATNSCPFTGSKLDGVFFEQIGTVYFGFTDSEPRHFHFWKRNHKWCSLTRKNSIWMEDIYSEIFVTPSNMMKLLKIWRFLTSSLTHSQIVAYKDIDCIEG